MQVSSHEKSILLRRTEERLRIAGWGTTNQLHMAGGEPWHGIAITTEFPGTIFGAFIAVTKAKYKSGKDEERFTVTPGPACDHCQNTGEEPGSIWTYVAAVTNPANYYKAREVTTGKKIDAWTPLNMHLFNRFGRECCRICGGRGYDLTTSIDVIHTWPQFRATPEGMHWHIEYEGIITASGLYTPDCLAPDKPTFTKAFNELYLLIHAKAGAARTLVNEGKAGQRMAYYEATKTAQVARSYQLWEKNNWLWVKPAQPLSIAQGSVMARRGAIYNESAGAYYFRNSGGITVEELDRILV